MSASIQCPKCGMTSHNPNDVRERYCGNCHQFHDFMTESGERKMTEDLEVKLTDDKTLHCFEIIYHVTIPGQTERAPLEIYLHTTQAFDLFQKLGEKLLEYIAGTSAELLRKVFENHEARKLLEETKITLQSYVVTGERRADQLAHLAVEIDAFLAITSAVNHPKPAGPDWRPAK